MSKTKNGGLYQYGAEPFEQQQFGPAGVEVEGVNYTCWTFHNVSPLNCVRRLYKCLPDLAPQYLAELCVVAH